MRYLPLFALVGVGLLGQELPSWWRALPDLPRLESRFVQESESAVFGKLRKEGLLQLSRGGRIRVAYQDGLVLVADGRSLVQFDPRARTAQKLDLRAAASDMPLLNVLLEPRALQKVYGAKAQGDGSVLLKPRKPGLPTVRLEGRGNLLKRITWTDPTGAQQVLELVDPRIPASLPDSAYKLRVPEGTRWLEVR